MTRKLTGIVLTVAFLFMTIFTAVPVADAKVLSPGDPGVRTAKFWIGQKHYEVNGIKHDMDVAPYAKDGRTLLPVRYIGYAMGLQEKDVGWNSAVQQASLKRWYGAGEFDYDEVNFRIGDDRSKADYVLNGWDYTAKLDVPAQVAPPGRIMVPFRAAVHALGGLAFWDGSDKSVTVVTWENAPIPVEQSVKQVECTLDKSEATVTYLDGTTKTVETEKPAAIEIVRPNGNRGCMVNTIEWLRLWGISDEAMFFDPVRGGLVVRGAATHNDPLIEKDLRQTTSYKVFYAGEKYGWDGFFKQWPANQEELNRADFMYVADSIFYGDYAVSLAGTDLWGRTGKQQFSGENKNTISVILE